MTITPTFNKSEIVAGNVTSIEEADVVLLLEDHAKKQDFDKIEGILNAYYCTSKDLVLLEHPILSSREHLLEQERKLGSWRISVLQDKNIEGWDHVHSEKWATEFYESQDVRKFHDAVNLFAVLDETTSIDLALQSYLILVDGAEKLRAEIFLPPPEEFEQIVRMGEFDSNEYKTLQKDLLKIGREMIDRMKGVYIGRTFPLRQRSLLETLKRLVPRVKRLAGTVFVVMGSNHGNPITSSHSSQVKSVVNYLSEKHKFITV